MLTEILTTSVQIIKVRYMHQAQCDVNEHVLALTCTHYYEVHETLDTFSDN